MIFTFYHHGVAIGQGNVTPLPFSRRLLFFFFFFPLSSSRQDLLPGLRLSWVAERIERESKRRGWWGFRLDFSNKDHDQFHAVCLAVSFTRVNSSRGSWCFFLFSLRFFFPWLCSRRPSRENFFLLRALRLVLSTRSRDAAHNFNKKKSVTVKSASVIGETVRLFLVVFNFFVICLRKFPFAD